MKRKCMNLNVVCFHCLPITLKLSILRKGLKGFLKPALSTFPVCFRKMQEKPLALRLRVQCQVINQVTSKCRWVF